MNFKDNNKFRTLSIILIVMFISSFINIPFSNTDKNEAKAQTIVNNKIDYSDELDTIKVLEIGPGNNSQLTGESYSDDQMPTETQKVINGKKVSITYVSMPLFISMVDDIEGLYDVVVISNNIKALNNKYDKTKKFRQYTNPQSEVRKGNIWASEEFLEDNSKSFIEYYSENDITKKRAKNITNMIDKGQLVYIDNSILSSNLSSTNLYNIFNNVNKDNFIKINSSGLTTVNLLKQYESIGKIRPEIKEIYVPKDESISDGKVNNERNMEFKIKVKSKNNQKIRFKLYLDVNYDGLYTEDELMKTIDEDSSNEFKEYEFSYKVVKSYVGLLPWKLEVVNINEDGSESTKSFAEYNVKFKAQNGARKIRVLQIYPNVVTHKNEGKGETEYSTTLSSNTKFENLLSNIKDDYNITIDNISTDEFCKEINYGSIDGWKKLEENYEMIIIGFCDNYNNEDFDNYLYNNALENIKKFVKDGNSLMLTHDTLSFYKGKAVNLTKKFRDYSGQSRYADPFRNGDESNLYRQYEYDQQTNSYSYKIKNIYHDSILNNKKYTYGETLLSKDGDKKTWNGGGFLYNSTMSFKVKNINNGPITEYPYDLTKQAARSSDLSGVKDKGYISVSKTHRQFFQLNLEDEDLVPWYNITPTEGYILQGHVGGNAAAGGDFSSNDSRNFYYTYSKGNITYSGTGHEGVSNVDEELRLLVNTIVKAYRGANHRPDIENTIEVKDKNENLVEEEIKKDTTSPVYAKRSEDYVFYTTPSDEDLDKVKVNITANGQVINNIKIADTDENYDGSLISSDTKLKVTIPKDIYKNMVPGETFNVNVEATDDMDAVNNSSFNVNVVNTPPTIKSYDNSAFIDDKIDETKSMVNLCANKEVFVNGTNDLTFTSIPRDLDGDSMNISVKTKGLQDSSKGIKEYEDEFSNKTTDDKLSITIPKEYYKYKEKGETFDVNITVKDKVRGKEQDSYTETFTIQIGNHEPTLENSESDEDGNYYVISQDTDNDGYKNAIYEINSAKDSYSFKTKVKDIDTSDKLKLTVYCEDSTEEGFNEVSSFLDNKVNSDISVSIPNKYYEKSVGDNESDENYNKYADKKRGESFKVKTVVEDNNDPSASYEEIFTVKIADNNIPTITAYENDGKNEILEDATSINTMAFGKTYDFYIKVNDLDTTDDLKVEASIDNKTAQFMVEDIDSETKLPIYTNLNGKVFKDGDKFKVQIPANRAFSKDSIIDITLKVTDLYNASSYRHFKVKIGPNNPPKLTNFEVGTNNEIENNKQSTNIIKIGENFLFDILPEDVDEDLLNVKIKVQDGIESHEILYKDVLAGKRINNVTIPRAFYKSKFKGDTFNVNVLVSDPDGGTTEKNFNVKIKDDDSTKLTNYENNGQDIIKDKDVSINHPNVNAIFNKNISGEYVLDNNLSGDDFNFITLPEDSDDEFVKVYVKVEVNNIVTLVKAYENVKTNEKLQVIIPRSYFKDLKRGESFKVYVDVSDNKSDSSVFHENPCDSKSFIVKLKDNILPEIKNYNEDSIEITDKASLEAVKEANYKFKTNIKDDDDKIVKLTVKVEGTTLIDKYVDEGLDNEIEIPTSFYAEIKRGSEFTVSVTATDEFGGSSTKEFKVKIKDNELPDLDNYTVKDDLTKDTLINDKGDGGTAKTFKNFVFITVPKDSDDPYVDVTVTADGQNILSKENVEQGKDLQVIIPKSVYENKKTGDKFEVVVRIDDKNGGSAEKSFIVNVKANNPPVINNYLKKQNVYVSNDTPSPDATVGKTEIANGDTVYEKNEETEEGYEFITIPKDDDENDKNNLKVNVKAKTKNGQYDLLEKSNSISEEELMVLIPKAIYENLGKGEAIEVTTTVTDTSGVSSTKNFNVIINHGPTIINKSSSGNIIEENTSVDVTRYHDFNFYSICDDIDEEDHLNLKVYLEDELTNNILVQPDEFGHDALITISSEKFNHLKENEKMKVTTIVTDTKGKFSKKTFYINMTNEVPTMTNYNVDNFEHIESKLISDNVIPSFDTESLGKENAIKQNKYLDFSFVSVVNDTNELEDLNEKITAKLISQNEENSIDKEIINKNSIKSNTRVSVTIPKSVYKNSLPGDYVKIVTTVTDEFDKSSSNVFYLKIDDINPTVTHGIIESEDKDGYISINSTETSPRVRTYDTVKFGGIATDVYCTNGQDAKFKLSISDDIDVFGDVVVYRILNNNGSIIRSNEWKMTYNNSDKSYYLNLNYNEVTSIGKVESEGMTFIVKYNGYMKAKSTNIRRDFINKLYVNSIEADANVYMQDFNIDTVPLF